VALRSSASRSDSITRGTTHIISRSPSFGEPPIFRNALQQIFWNHQRVDGSLVTMKISSGASHEDLSQKEPTCCSVPTPLLPEDAKGHIGSEVVRLSVPTHDQDSVRWTKVLTAAGTVWVRFRALQDDDP
jgi:hypothetical protein